jgi:S-DNA-T family DNA segregation ATPase FtsK/SpoIIIE
LINSSLSFQADQIEYLLARHRLPARVTGGTVTPRTVRFQVVPGPGTKLRRFFELTEELALILGASTCRVFRQKNCLQVEVPRQQHESVPLLPLCGRLSHVPPCTAVLGLEHDGRPLLLQLPSPDVSHVLIAGSTGSGKTELTRSMIASLIHFNRQAQLQLLLIDPKNGGFAPFRESRHLLRPVITGPELAIEALQDLVEEMIRRDREGCSLPRIGVFIDELADLALVAQKEIQNLLSRLAQRGRQAGIHLIACTQKPTVSVVGSLVKANFPVRLVGAVPSPEDAKVATGLARTGAEKLLGQGDFLAIARGEAIRFQSAFVSDQEIRAVLDRSDHTNRVPLERAGTGTDGLMALTGRVAGCLKRVK